VNGNPQSTNGNTSAATAYCPGPSTPYGTLCNGTTNGRSAILATAIGEESFKDATGSGYFNPGDTVAWDAADTDNNFTSGADAGQPKPWMDTFEPFLNEWELYDASGTAVYQLGEPYLDFFNKGVWEGPDNLVESALCEGPLCNTTSSSVAIFASNVIVLSGSHANFLPAAGSSFSLGAGGTVTFRIFDDRNQQMPNGTTVAATLASTAGTIAAPSSGSYTWPCSAAVGGTSFSFTIEAPTTGGGTGLLILTVTTPSGLVTTAQYTVTTT
jgi:hypothetical protein